MRKVYAEAVCKIPNLAVRDALSAKRLAAKEAALDAARKELDAEKALFFEGLIKSYGYDALVNAGVL